MGIRLIKKNERADGFSHIWELQAQQAKETLEAITRKFGDSDRLAFETRNFPHAQECDVVVTIDGNPFITAEFEGGRHGGLRWHCFEDDVNDMRLDPSDADAGKKLITVFRQDILDALESLYGFGAIADEELSRLLYLKEHPKRRLHESLSDWADREVKIACKKEDGYGTGCCKSALKAFHSLMEDGHSGFSIGITKAILDRLIEGKPLTPIEDDPDLWNECGGFDEGKAVYQNARMSALFKEVFPDGTVKFDDVDRAVLVEVEGDGTETTWPSELASKLVDEIVGPITLPYYPKDNPYRVYAQQFDSVSAEVGCYDTSHIFKIVDPDGYEIPCERFYAETEDGMAKIDKGEYLRRERSYQEQLKKRAKD